eukprot:gene10860-11014_t
MATAVLGASNGLEVVLIGGVCVPAVRRAVSARFSASGRQVLVTLNALARDASLPCSSLFSSNSTKLLGGKAWCKAVDRTVTIDLDPLSATLVPDDTLELSSSQLVLVDKLQNDASFSGNIKVVTCIDCTAPVAVLTGPEVIAEACEISQGSPAVFDASYSYDPSGRPLASITWGGGDVANPVLSQVINSANAINSNRLLLPQSMIAQLPDGSYSLSVTVRSFLGQQHTALLTFNKTGSGAVPVISIVGGPSQQFKLSEGLNLASFLEPSSVCSGKMVQYSWESGDGAWEGVLTNYSRKNLVLQAPLPAVAGGRYPLVLRARFKGSLEAATARATVTAVGSPLSISLVGPAGDVRSGTTISLNAGGSLDPDDPKGLKPMMFSWDCQREDYPHPCFETTDQGEISGARWNLPVQLLAVDKAHRITVTATKGIRSGQASLTVVPRSPQLAIPTGWLSRDCAGDGILLVEVPESSRQVVLQPDELPAAGAVTVTAVMTRGGLTGNTSITVELDAKPVWRHPLQLVPQEGLVDTFPDASFQVSAAGLYDDDQLRQVCS